MKKFFHFVTHFYISHIIYHTKEKQKKT